MKTKEVKKMTVDQIKSKINLLKKDLFNFRFRKVNSQIQDTAKFSETKRDIAKLFTELVIKDKNEQKKIKR